MKLIASVLLMMVPVSYAQTEKPKTPPIISIELREKYFKAQSEYQVAAIRLRELTSEAQVKNSALQDVVSKINATCGENFLADTDKDGEIVCIDKPKNHPGTPKK